MALRILNIALALLVFISSTGFTVNSHFCKDKLKDFRIFIKAKDCYQKHRAEKKTARSCHVKKQSCDNNCCHNTSEYFKLELDQQLSTFELKPFTQTVFIAVLWIFNNHNNFVLHNRSYQFLKYKPPPIVYDILVLLQTFLL